MARQIEGGLGRMAPPGFHFLYFFGRRDGAEIKLGKTRQKSHLRRLQHENHNGFEQPMEHLAVWLGNGSDENALKEYFKHERSRPRSKEWLHPTERVLDYIRFLRDLPYVARDESPEEMAILRPEPSREWLPGEEHQRSAAQLVFNEPDDPWGAIFTADPGEGDYYTHPCVMSRIRRVMGVIDLDPASCRKANEVVGARWFYGERENGLLQPWHAKRIWVNPPFGEWEDWGPKIAAEWNQGEIDQLAVLLSTRASTAKCVTPLLQAADAMFVPCGRIPFWGPKAGSPDEGHMILYFGLNLLEFSEAFTRAEGVFPGGTVWRRADSVH